MGNCLRHESEMHWAGEDWDEFITPDQDHCSTITREARAVNCKSSDPSHDIKIRLTKKQLQDLLSKASVHDLTLNQQSFSCLNLINRKTEGYEEGNQHRLWKPILQSIPEVI